MTTMRTASGRSVPRIAALVVILGAVAAGLLAMVFADDSGDPRRGSADSLSTSFVRGGVVYEGDYEPLDGRTMSRELYSFYAVLESTGDGPRMREVLRRHPDAEALTGSLVGESVPFVVAIGASSRAEADQICARMPGDSCEVKERR